MSREAMKQALEALERSVATCFDQYAHEQVMSQPDHFINQSITFLRQAIAEAEKHEVSQEPVAWQVHPFDYGIGHKGVYARTDRPEQVEMWKRKGWTVQPLYTRPQPAAQWVGLTGEAYDWDIERCRAYATQLRDKTRANTAEHAAQAIEWLLAQLASHQIIGKNQEPKREWVGLTDEEMKQVCYEAFSYDPYVVARAIEAKLKEKNT